MKLNRPAVLLVYVTGRTFPSARQLLSEEGLLLPDVLITDVGTEIRMSPHYEPDRGWAALMSRYWDPGSTAAIVASVGGLQRQEVRPRFRLAYFVEETGEGSTEKPVLAGTVLRIEQQIRRARLRIRIVQSMGRIIDIIPGKAGKGEAVHHVRKLYGIARNNTYVCGDSGNDLSLFSRGYKGIVVGNAGDELTEALRGGASEAYFSRGLFAAGILEGLQHYGLLSAEKQSPPSPI